MFQISYKKRVQLSVTSGCSRISAGCKNCPVPEQTSQALHVNSYGQLLEEPDIELNKDISHLKDYYPIIVEVNAHGDLFHEKIPLEHIIDVFKQMNELTRLMFIVRTKRSERLWHDSRELTWTDNIWMGVDVEDESSMYRIDHLKATPARVKAVFFEPLLGPIGAIDLDGINWVNVGGETAFPARPMAKEWVFEIKAQCEESQVPFFFNKWIDPQSNKVCRNFCGSYYKKLPINQL